MQCGAETEKRSAICNKTAKKGAGAPVRWVQHPKIRKNELVRIVRSPEGEVSVDLTGKRSGRGAYLCPSAACLAKARKAKRLEHAFGVPVPDEVFERLTEEMACAEQAVKEAMPRGE